MAARIFSRVLLLRHSFPVCSSSLDQQWHAVVESNPPIAYPIVRPKNNTRIHTRSTAARSCGSASSAGRDQKYIVLPSRIRQFGPRMNRARKRWFARTFGLRRAN
ncbi:uncharacterized protein K489DRAFT_98299 [Dissoconium aciculare CBS 342.82]|uniref:Secreted protein n=1 Tax=Dissoconium aciculare CBS 342.82 TaxID=1314786 RepID=A0A6J3MFX7_9PEZI|nr:uncharacterized protein K489DRAFT_98299 [Dissoconium aciculare CBS 342.82]KAF1825787.1 hypothetical protein K489DRAFT_98299 [Dissoconium aciculare CBS 342.82]